MASVLATLLLVAACASDGTAPSVDVGGGTGDVGGAATGSGESGGGVATGSDGATATGGSSTGGTTGTGSSGTTDGSAPASDVIEVGSRSVGGVAAALLRPGRGDRVVLEVRAQAGAAPRQATIDHVVQVLGAVSGKTVAVDGVDAIGGGAQDWTQQGVISAAASAAQIESGRSQVVLRLLFLRGSYGGDRSVLGVAVAGDVAAVFSDRVDSAAGVLVDPAVVEDAVTMHEVGHLLALVDLILGTGRGDPDHPGHSRNKRSVMYWQVESDLISQLIDGGIPRDFDDDDRAELAQIRAG